MIKLAEVKSEQKELLWNIHQKYLYEMTNYYDDEMDETGNYHPHISRIYDFSYVSEKSYRKNCGGTYFKNLSGELGNKIQ